MRIIFWLPQYWPYIGGVEVSTAQLLPDLMARGHEVCVVTSHSFLDLPDEDQHEGISIFRFPFVRALSERDLPSIAALQTRVAELKRRFRPDVINVTLTDPSVFFHLQTASSHRAPLVVSIRVALEAQTRLRQDSLASRAIAEAVWVTANSQAMLDDVREIWPELSHCSSVIYDTLKVPALTPAPLNFDAPRLLCLGRVVKDKGFDLAIAAFARIAGSFPAARLVIAGDGPARANLEAQAAALGLSDRIEFKGWVTPQEVPELINSSTVVLVPSRWREALGLVAIQAAQMGRPVIATRVGGLPEAVIEGHTGLLVEMEDVRGLAAAIAELLSKPLRAEAMGSSGQKHASTTFGWDRHVEAFESLYAAVTRGD